MIGLLARAASLAALAYAARSARFRNGWVRVPLREPDPSLPSLSIVVPARNEERSIEECVHSLLAQRYDDFEVIVVDDRSSDMTGPILERIAAQDHRLRVVHGAPLPDGWVGKPWALAQGFAIARGAWLLFTDADSVHAPLAASSAMTFARDGRIDMLTLVTQQELGTFWERALLPSILGMVLFATGPLNAINDPARENALANGQFILIERRAYEGIGTHAALRGEIAEDLELARRIKRDGRYRMMLARGNALVRVRMYRGFSELWGGFVKNVYVGANGNLPSIVLGFSFTSLISYVPLLTALAGVLARRPLVAAESVLALAATVSTASWSIGLTGLPRRLGWYAPLGLSVFAAIVVTSTASILSGRGVVWRGRRYPGT